MRKAKGIIAPGGINMVKPLPDTDCANTVWPETVSVAVRFAPVMFPVAVRDGHDIVPVVSTLPPLLILINSANVVLEVAIMKLNARLLAPWVCPD